MSYLTLLQSAPKRTLSDLLLQLPKHGVGCLVTRDTWHPAGDKYWEVVEVVPQRDNPVKLNAWGYKYYKGERTHDTPKRIASVWKYNWVWKPRAEEKALVQRLAYRREVLQAEEAAAAVALTGDPGSSTNK